MDVRLFDDAIAFATATHAFLLEHEPENNLIFGLTHDIGAGRYDDFMLATVEHDGDVVLAALMTPPHNLTMSVATRDDAVATLATALKERGTNVPGVGARVPEARAFVAAWGAPAHVAMSTRIMAIDEVRAPDGITGAMRDAGSEDRDTVAEWLVSFARDVGEEGRDPADAARGAEGLTSGRPDRAAVIWDDEGPVSMAAFMGPTPNGIRIGAVYTPPEQRRRGYASAIVAALSARLLESGKRFCFLYTDAANPTSNHIYEQIGYRFVCDAAVYRFDGADPLLRMR